MKRSLSVLGVVLLSVSQLFAANFYWVGGSGKWSEVSHWSATENGPGGAGIPTATDDVFVLYSSHANRNFRLEIDGEAVCASLLFDSPGLLLFGDKNQSIVLHGSLEVKQAFGDQMEGSWVFASTQAGNRISNPGSFTGNLVFDGAGAWDFTSAVAAKNISLVSGSLNTNGFAVNCGVFDLSGSNKRSLHLGSSVVNLDTWNASVAENLVFEAGTSELLFSGKIDPAAMNFKVLTYYNISPGNTSKDDLTFNVFRTDPSCHDDEGSILVQMTSGVPGYRYYLIGNGFVIHPADGISYDNSPIHIFNNLQASTKYLILVEDFMGSTGSKSDSIVNPPVINIISIVPTNILGCPDDLTGEIAITADGGTGDLDYSILEPENYQELGSFTGLAAGTYQVRVRDNNLCEITAPGTTVLTEPARTNITSVLIDSIDCRDDDDAILTITASNAERTFELSIGGAYQAGNIFDPVGDGSYTLTARDQNGCIAFYGSNPIVVPNPPALSATFTTDSIDCNGGNDGSITIIPAGGTAPYQYSITGAAPFSASATFPNLGLGAYTVAVQDFHGCTAQAAAQANIYEPDVMTKVTDSQVNITCRDDNDGQIILEAAGGTKPYTYSIPSKPNIVTGGTATFTNLGQGQYTATVTDDNSCPSSIIWVKHTFANPTAVTFSHTKSNETPCNNSDNGTITITAAGGTGNGYTYTINNGASWESNGGIYTDLTAGNYQVNVRDANLCEATMVLVQITQPSALGMSLTSTDETDCSYSNDGTIIITATGGTPPRVYSIDNGTNWLSNDGNFTSVLAGNYVAIVRDNNMCLSVSQAVTIDQPDSLYISNVAAVNENPCNSSNNGSISITATGGDGTYFYTFDNEGSYGAANNASGLIAASYTIRVQDGNGCFSDPQVVPITEPTVVNFTPTKTNCTCFGLNNGTITITPTGGTGAGYEYSLDGAGWLPIVNPISGIGPLPAPHNLKVRDGAGCESVTKQVTITQPAKVDFTALPTDETPCFNSNNGSITIQSAFGGAGAGVLTNYQYSLEGPVDVSFGASFVFTDLTAGSYTVVARDFNLCESDPEVYSIDEPDAIALIEAHTNESPCSYNNNGTIVLAASGGSGTGYRYSIDGGNDFSNTTGNFSNLIAGTYKCLARDDQNCESDTTTIVITEPVPIDFDTDVTDVTPCFGGSNGQIQVNASGGTAPYRFSRVPGVYVDNGGLFTGLTAGNNTIRVQDAGGCLSDAQIVPVGQPGEVTFSETHTDPLCHDDANGTITVSPLGGSGSFEFSLNDGATWPYSDGDITGLSADTYTVKVRDVPNHCESTSQVVNLNNPTTVAITMPIAYTDVTFFGGNDGTITLNISGGTGPYDISIDGGGTFPYTGVSPFVISGLVSNTYHIIVADIYSCTADGGNVTISEPGQLTIVSSIPTSPGCYDANTGSITITTSGGSGPIKYSIDGGAHYFTDVPNDHVYTFSNKHSGVYHVMVQDNVITVDGGNVTISDPAQLVIDSQTKTNITCNNANDGTIHIVASGGTGDLTYQCPTKPSQINNGLFTNLAQAQYTITVTDANGCFVQSNKHTVINPPLVVIQSVNNTQISCNGADDGSITVAVSGGTPETGSQYHFSLDGGATSVQGTSPYTFNDLIPGNYNVVVWDKNICTKIYTGNPVAMNEPPAIVISDVSHTDVLCHGLSTGTITITASGGTPFVGNEFDFSINGGSNYSKGISPFTFTNQAAGNFAVVVRDASGCTLSGGTEVIAQPASAISVSDISWSPDPVLCNGDLVTLTITATGGTGTLQYSINNGTNYFNNGGVFIDIPAGTYHIKVKDDNNCELDYGPVTIPEPTPIVIGAIDQENIACFGDNTGSICIPVSGGTSPYEYSINGGVVFVTDSCFSGLVAGVYAIVIRDANNCIKNGPVVTLTEPNNPLVINSSIPTHITTCAGNAEGQIAIAVSGGTPIGGTQYKFSKDGGLNYITSTSPYSFSALLAGPYHIMIMDANDCVIDGGTITITEPAAVVINSVVPVSPLCHGASTGTITISAVGGTGLKLYSIEEPANYVDNGGVFTGLAAGAYHIRVQDANTCVADGGIFNLNDPDALNISVVDSLLSCGSLPILEADTTFLPDGSGVSYVSTIHHTDFDPGQSVLTANDIESICINIEHSYAQDLTMVLTCPDGKSVTLVDQDAGGSFVGKPIKDESDFSFPEINVASGEGFSYCFTQSATETWTSVYGDSTYTYTDLGGFPHVNKIYVPSGVYRPKQNISNLVGCPLNGDWTITVTDNYLGDNGYLFSWGLNFNPSAFPEGYCNGMVEIGVDGGTPDYSFEWSNGRTTQQITDLCAGDYTVTVTDANGCQANYTTTVEDVDLQLVVDDITHVTCQGQNNGSITVHMTGGNEPYTYLWENGETSPSLSNLEAGMYSLTVTDFNSCEYIDSIEVNYQFSITTSMADTALVSCNSLSQGPQTGTATVVVTATEPITYEWTNGETDATATQLLAGWNFVTVTDANLCPAVDSIFMDQPAQLTATALLTEPLCNGDSNGSVTVTGGGGTGAYSVLWEDNSSDNPRNLLASGNYAFTLTDANNCFISQPVSLDQPDSLKIVLTATPTGCGVSTGTAQVVANGGTPVYSYLWSNGSIIDQAIGLGVGMHYVTVTDLNGCVKTDSVLIQNDTDLAISGYTVASPVLCNGDCNGSLVVNLTGGAGPYTYAWSNGVNNDTTINLCANTDYSVTVTDANNCVVFGTTQITEPEVLSLSIVNPVQISCLGGNNGSAEANPIGGTGPYTFNWRDVSNAQVGDQLSATNLVAGKYYLTVSDFHGCTYNDSITLTEPATAVSATHTVVPATCGNADGSAEVNPAGGTAPYTFLWSNGAGTDSIADNLSVNIYYVTVYDAKLCPYVDTVEILDNSTLSVVVDTIINASCFNLCNGSATVVATGGSGTYDYIWKSGSIDSIAENLCAGNDTVTVTDQNGCQRSLGIYISQPSQIVAVITNNPLILCAGDTTGTATVDVNGGLEPYTFEWTDPMGSIVDSVASSDTATTIYSVVDGSYNLVITDANACVQPALPVTISEIPAMQLSFSNTNASCGNPDGESVVTVSGGTGPYTYEWSDLVTTNDTLENVPAGTYFVTVTDANSCVMVGNTTIQNDSDLVVDSVEIVQPVSCYGSCNGTIRVHISGGTEPYQFDWGGGNTGATLNNVCGGQTYTLTITDFNTCTLMYSYTVPQPDTLTVSATVTNDVLCFGDNTGAATAIPTGGTPNYFYSWRNEANQQVSTVFNPTTLAAGRYVVILTDGNNCQATDTIEIEQPATPLFANAQITLSSCLGPTGTAAIIPTGGTPFSGIHPYTYLWLFDNSTDSTHVGLGVDVYTVVVSDSNNCEYRIAFEMEDDSDLTAQIDSIKQISCYSLCDGIAWASASNGQGNLSYAWSNGDIGRVANELCAAPISVTVTDEVGCKDIAFSSILEPEPLSVIESVVDVLCAGQATGSASIAVSGGWAPYTIVWEDSEGNTVSSSQVLNGSTISGVTEGTYFYTILDDGGCSLTENIYVDEPDALLVDFEMANAECQMSNGSITATITGGTLPYTIVWSNMEWLADSLNTEHITNIPAGIYFFTLTDANGCSFSDVIIMNNPTAPEIEVELTQPVTCMDSCNGRAMVNILLGSTEPYSFEWSNGETSQEAVNLCAQYYYVYVEDQNRCKAYNHITLTNDSVLQIEFTLVKEPTCFNGSDGEIEVTPYYGSGAPFTYNWEGEQTEPLITGLSSGWYSVTVMDGSSCRVEGSIFLDQPDSIFIDVVINSPVICANDSTGNITVRPHGGTAPYYVALLDAHLEVVDSLFVSDTVVFANLPGQSYTIRVYDTVLCWSDFSFELDNPEPMIFSFTTTETECLDSTGSAKVVVTGGYPPYTYNWFTLNEADSLLSGFDTDSIWDLPVNFYILEVVDAIGCYRLDTVEVEDKSDIDFFVTIFNHPTCTEVCNGSAAVHDIIGGTPEYTFLWETGSGTETNDIAYQLCLGANQVFVIDAEGCRKVKTVLMNSSNILRNYFSSNNDISNPGELCTGMGAAVPSGGIPPYQYQWDDENNTIDSVLYNLCEGEYHLTITDQGGCILFDTLNIIKDQFRYEIVELKEPDCYQGNDGVIEIISKGGKPGNYQYKWAFEEWTNYPDYDSITPRITNLKAGRYYFTLTDNGIGYIEDSIDLNQPIPVVPYYSIIRTECDQPTGQISVYIGEGGTAPFIFQWAFEDWSSYPLPDSSGNSISNLGVGIYNLNVTDFKNCQYYFDVELNDTSPFYITDQSWGPECYNENTGQITIVPYEGEQGFLYQWLHDPSNPSNIADNLYAGNYYVTATDGNGCVRTLEISLENPDSISFNLRDTIPINCFNSCTGGVHVTNIQGNAGAPNIMLKKDNEIISSGLSPFITNICKGDYEVLVRIGNCYSRSVPFSINSPSKIEADFNRVFAACNYGDSSGMLIANISGGTPYVGDPATAYKYLWDNGDTTHMINDLPSGYYRLHIEDSNACPKDTLVFLDADINIYPSAEIFNFNLKDTTICYGDSIQLLGTSNILSGGTSMEPDLAVWFPGNSPVYNLKVAPHDTTRYSYIVHKANCFNFDTVLIRVYPELQIDAGDYPLTFVGTEIHLLATANTEFDSVTWIGTDFALNPTSYQMTGLDTFITPQDSLWLYVNAYKYNGWCSVVDSTKIRVYQELDPPSGFTPNGDGINDTWLVPGIMEFNNVEVKIFNRWGEMVYEVKGRYQPWEGKNKKGKLLPIGTYYYIIDLHDGKTKPVSGPVTIIR